VFILDYYLGHIAFPDQIDKISEWFYRWKPEIIGVEANAFQRAIVQQANRLEGFPGIVPYSLRGRKRSGFSLWLRCSRSEKFVFTDGRESFIDQWVSFDPQAKNQKDDLLGRGGDCTWSS
jgi:hypothetical protein